MSESVPGPAANPSNRRKPDQTSPPEVPREGSELLVVEDDPFSRSALIRLLEQGGYHVTAFATARAALDWLASDEGACRGILGGVVDVHLPDADGIDLTRQLRELLGSKPRIVIVSGDTTMATISRLRDAGADGFIGKPLRFPVLLDALFPEGEGQS